jgi:hypothetical protein
MASRHNTHSIIGDDAVPPSGDPVIEVTGNFDFGSSPVGTPKSEIFTIQNIGGAPLVLTLPVTITGAGFSVTSQPSEATLAPNETITFTVQASAAARQTYNAIINIVNNSDVTPYTEDITIIAVQAVMGLTGVGGNAITNGSVSATLNGTDFGITPVGTPDTLAVTAANSGDAALVISAINLPSGFTHDAVLPLTINPSNNSVITISSTAASFERWAGTVTFTNNSAVPAFTFDIVSRGRPAGNVIESVHAGYGPDTPSGLSLNVFDEINSFTTAEAIVYSQVTGSAKPKWWQSIAGLNNRGTIEFAGDDCLLASGAPLGGYATEWTWAMVLRVGVGFTAAVTLVSEGNNGSSGPFIRIRQATADVTGQIRNTAASVSANASGTQDINNGNPHLCVLYNNPAVNTLYLYIDNLVTPNASASTATLGAIALNISALGALARATPTEACSAQIPCSYKFLGNNVANCASIKTHYAIA